MNRHVGCLLLIVLAAGCGPHFTGLTVPPPGKTAELDNKSKVIQLSRGVALAFECLSDRGAPCQNATAAVADPKVCSVHASYLDQLADTAAYGSNGYKGKQNRTVFVVAGRAIGETRVSVRSSDGGDTILVRILSE